MSVDKAVNVKVAQRHLAHPLPNGEGEQGCCNFTLKGETAFQCQRH
jgi:hypothetical protein